MIHDKLTDTLGKAIDAAVSSLYPSLSPHHSTVSVPTDKKKADYVSNISFQLAKELSQSPLKIAQEIVEEINKIPNDIFSTEAIMPGFINFRLSNVSLSAVIKDIKKHGSAYGKNTMLEGETWVIEHTSPNPNKAMHVGHLRNNLVGMSIAKILEYSGAKVIRDCVDNDRGIAITKAMWGYLKYERRDKDKKTTYDVDYWIQHKDEWLTPSEINVKPDHFVGECYTLASEDFKNDKDAQDAIRQMAVLWEAGDKNIWALWELIISYAHQGITETLDRVGNHWDKIWHEHEHYNQGKDLVAKGLEKGTFKRLENGAILTNLDAYNIPDTIMLKSDGTSLYITQDIALTKLKKDSYGADKLLWVIGPEQSVAMKQVFAVCEQLGVGNYNDFAHIPYGLVNITDESGAKKKMSSRGGNTLLIDDLLDEVKNTLLNSDRGYTPMLADQIAVAAIKCALLKPARTTDTSINIQQAVSLEGDSGLYLLYTFARVNTVIAKNMGSITSGLSDSNYTARERELIVKLLYYPEHIKTALSDYSPNVLVEYLLDIAHSFNSLYAKERFISEDLAETNKKMELSTAVSTVFSSALDVIGVKPVERI
ncbi:MAG TPA: arginine--tRNA ligase [Candidatus Saccharibacteria bacterium]|nr:arginine--tRNA ligase [Candidatus Saccharibacteria bacterium]